MLGETEATIKCVLLGRHYNPDEILITNNSEINKEDNIKSGKRVKVISCYCGSSLDVVHIKYKSIKVLWLDTESNSCSDGSYYARRFDRIKK